MALIGACSVVVVALIGLLTATLSRAPKTSESPPAADPETGERLAVAETHLKDARGALNTADHRLDKVEEKVEQLRWEMNQMKQWRDDHRRHHGSQP